MTDETCHLLTEDEDREEVKDEDDDDDCEERKENHTVTRHFDKFIIPCLGEFTGVCIFVFVGCMAIPHPLGVKKADMHPTLAAVPIALAHGFTIVLLVVGFGRISGAHFNPAVTLGVFLSGDIKPVLAASYVIVQLLGAMLGAAMCRGIQPVATYVGVNGGAQILPSSMDPGHGIMCEMLLTSLLVLSVIMTTVHKKIAQAPLAIGFSVIVCNLAGTRVTGASMNPARSFGPAMALSVYNSDVWTHHYVYWVGPCLGALLAALSYRLIFASSDKRLFSKKSKPLFKAR